MRFVWASILLWHVATDCPNLDFQPRCICSNHQISTKCHYIESFEEESFRLFVKDTHFFCYVCSLGNNMDIWGFGSRKDGHRIPVVVLYIQFASRAVYFHILHSVE